MQRRFGGDRGGRLPLGLFHRCGRCQSSPGARSPGRPGHGRGRDAARGPDGHRPRCRRQPHPVAVGTGLRQPDGQRRRQRIAHPCARLHGGWRVYHHRHCHRRRRPHGHPQLCPAGWGREPGAIAGSHRRSGTGGGWQTVPGPFGHGSGCRRQPRPVRLGAGLRRPHRQRRRQRHAAGESRFRRCR